jgi:hypothetical protein
LQPRPRRISSGSRSIWPINSSQLFLPVTCFPGARAVCPREPAIRV